MSSLVRNFGYGFITLWYGSLVSIPSGWALCDGTQGTPNLTDQFIIGAGDTYEPTESGGSILHNHGFTSDGHTHTLPGGFGISTPFDFENLTNSVVLTGTTDNASLLPKYKSLVYIMEL